MARVEISITVDEDVLAEARRLYEGSPDAVLLDEALRALLARHHRVTIDRDEIDAQYAAAYEAHPLDEPDEWGDLESWRKAAGAT